MKNIIYIIICLLAVSLSHSLLAQKPAECEPFTVGTIVDTDPEIITAPLPILPTYPNPNPTPPPVDDYREIIWLHGLGGDGSSWADAPDATTSSGTAVAGYPKRKARSYVMDYSTYGGHPILSAIEQINNVVLGDIRPQVEDTKDMNFVIAHSQGGVIARGLDDKYIQQEANPNEDDSRLFNGIVTFGTPHQGAQVLNNKDMFEPFAIRACEGLTVAPITELVESNPILDIFSGTIQEKRLQLCEFFGETLLPLVFNDFDQQITEGYKVGGDFITDLNNAPPSPINKVAFYGIEQDNNDLFWRLFYSLVKTKVNDFPTFGAQNGEQHFVDSINMVRMRYQGLMEFAQSEIDWLDDNLWWLCPVSILDAAIACVNALSAQNDHVERRNAYRIAIDWYNNVNNQYKTIIGARIRHEIVDTYCRCEMQVTYQNPCPEDCGEISVVDYVTYTEKPSDGVVLAESAMNFPGLASPNHARVLQGSNHQQMRNDQNTKIALKALFSGNEGLPYF
ncbi:MAG: hypothetical protein WAS72_06485, partial [Saprospiraceae bacterium]